MNSFGALTDRTWSDDWPGLRRRECLVFVYPRRHSGALSTRVRQLNGRHCALCLHKGRHRSEWLNLLVRPETTAAGSDAASPFHGSRLHHHQAGTADGPGAQVNEVPLGDVSLHGRVHGHRGDDDSIRQEDVADSHVSAISGPCKSWGLCPPESETLCCSGKCETRYFLISMCAHVKTDEQQFGYDYSYQ
ncbi:hypothetical protein TYRP_012167 [Tyrophagus putrescentiae]|nr:hypothetical protein TYRP_012167 [Tyrophagus putrescentiae]